MTTICNSPGALSATWNTIEFHLLLSTLHYLQPSLPVLYCLNFPLFTTARKAVQEKKLQEKGVSEKKDIASLWELYGRDSGVPVYNSENMLFKSQQTINTVTQIWKYKIKLEISSFPVIHKHTHAFFYTHRPSSFHSQKLISVPFI